MNIRLTLAFDGTAYHGWQIQKGHPTIQGILRESVQKITGESVAIIGSGRTDAGTHARALVANFFTASQIPPHSLAKALNSILPRDIRVLSARQAPADFHAQHSARSKIYHYQIYRGEVMPPHLAHEHYHYPYPLNVKTVALGAKLFMGKHDFASFAKTKRFAVKVTSLASPSGQTPEDVARDCAVESAADGEANTVRHVFRSEIRCEGLRLLFTVEANGFLHHMVRTMMGTLLELGRGRITLDHCRELFDKRDRTWAGFTVPAHGLILARVRY